MNEIWSHQILWLVLPFQFEKVREAYAIGFSFTPSVCDITTPNPYPEASAANTSGLIYEDHNAP